MKLYLLGGLGADERIFHYLNLEIETTVIHWIGPLPKENLSEYVLRLSSQIDDSEDFGLLGVSFGGIVAIELANVVMPHKLILISSITSRNQLLKIYLAIGQIGILDVVPDTLIKPPSVLLSFLFGAKNKDLLKQIVRDTNPDFIRWALNCIVKWSNDKALSIESIRIHGTHDKLIPLKGEAIEIEGGGHFMIVDRAQEISKIINSHLRK